MQMPSISRREALTLLGVSGTAALLPGLARADIGLGGKTLTTVSDGNLVLPIDFSYPDAPRDELTALLDAAGLSTDELTPACNVTLLRDGARTVLFDVGSGPFFMPTAGELVASLDAAGVAPEEVTDVIFTHAHPDHIWGLLDDFDDLVFAEASYYINRAEWDYWNAEDTFEKTPEARKTFVVGAQNRFAALQDTITFFEYGDEILPGIEAIDTSGHTPGHTSFAVHDDSRSAMVGGDAITHAPISFAHPEWPSGADQDAEQGVRTRIRLLDRLAADGMELIGFHLPGPGIGVAERNGGAYRFVPA